MNIKDIIAGLISPITEIIKKRQDRKAAKDSAKAKLSAAQQDSEYKLELNDQELEQLQTTQTEKSWKDEYATVSVVSILNIFVLGGVQAAYGETRTLEGIAIAVRSLTEAGVNVGFLLEAVILAAVGLNIWRKA